MNHTITSTLPTDVVAEDHTLTWRMTRGVSQGNAEAIEWFYNRCFDVMLAESIKCSGRDESFSLDIVQDATLKALNCIRPMNSDSHLQAWVRLLVRSVVYDKLRQENRRRRRELERLAQRRMNSEEDQFEVDRQARLIWLEEQLRQLDGGSAKLLRLRYRFGWTLASVAEAIGIKTGAVDGRIQRLVQQLRKQAETEFHE